MFQWTGPQLQAEIVPWTMIKDAASAKSVASLIETTPRKLFGGGTSISGAIDTAMRRFPHSPFRGERRVIDVSGDGSNNRGRSVTNARDEAVAADIVINGLPILAWEPDLDYYYKQNVIGGPGAFMIVARDFDTFADAILKKMITEIAMNGRGRTRSAGAGRRRTFSLPACNTSREPARLPVARAACRAICNNGSPVMAPVAAARAGVKPPGSITSFTTKGEPR